MKPNKPPRKTVPTKVLQSAVAVSTRQLLEAGAIVLNSRFGFTDEQAAEWIELTAGLAGERMDRMTAMLKGLKEATDGPKAEG